MHANSHRKQQVSVPLGKVGRIMGPVIIGPYVMNYGPYLRAVPTDGEYLILHSGLRTLATSYDHWVAHDELDAYFEDLQVDWMTDDFPILTAYYADGKLYVPTEVQCTLSGWREARPVQVVEITDV